MSFVFPKPDYIYFDYDDNYSVLFWNREPDYDELLIRLSLFAFTRLSPSDQQEKVVEISHTVNVQDMQFSDELSEASRLAIFEELLKKLPFSDQLKIFLSKVIEKFKRERQGMTSSDDEARSNIWTSSSFGEFFLGFSVIWFEGQSTRGQDMLIEQLDLKATKGVVVIEKRRQEESEEDFKLRRFKELCKCVVDFKVQEQFLKICEIKLENWGSYCDRRLIGEPQDLDSAAELLSRLWTFGVSLLSAKYQEHEIVQMSTQVEFLISQKKRSTQVESGVETEIPPWFFGNETEIPLGAAEDHHDEDAVRMKRLTDLFNQVPVPTRIDLFNGMKKTLLAHKRYSEAVRVFKEQGSRSQTKIIEDMLHEKNHRIARKMSDIVEKFSGESEEDFRFRRFNQICIKHLSSTWGYIYWPEAFSPQLHAASDPYDELLFGVAIIWFKATCANIRRNPVQLILFGKIEIGDRIEKLPEESEEDYRLRRFEESFKQLEFTSQENVLGYIQETISADLGYPLGYPYPRVMKRVGGAPVREGVRYKFDLDWINYRPTNPRDQVAATTQAAISGQGPQGS